MKDESDPADGGMVDPHDAEPDNPGLEAWLARTTTPLDILALCTIWLTLVPINRVHEVGGHPIWWFVARIALSVVYGIDIAVRTRLSNVGTRYLVRHPVAVLAVLMPVLRLLFSIRLLGAMFRKGNLGHFLSVAALLFLNLVIIVWGFENREAGANITTIWLGIWWGFVTVATVGYGDYYPITVGGRIFAVMLMGLGLITIAVITAQIASSFMDQAAARRSAAAAATDAPTEGSTNRARGRVKSRARNASDTGAVSIASTSAEPTPAIDTIEDRLIRIEELLRQRSEPAAETQT